MLDAAIATAAFTWVAENLAGAITAWARGRDGEKATRVRHLTLAPAGWTSLGFGSFGCATAIAIDAGIELREGDFLFEATSGFFEVDLQIVAQIVAALCATSGMLTTAESLFEKIVKDAATSAAEHLAEDFKRVVEPASWISTARSRARTGTKSGVTEAVISSAFLRIAEGFVGFAKFLEFFLGILVAGILVRMILERELAVSLFNFFFRSIPQNAEHLVVIALGHGQSLSDQLSGFSPSEGSAAASVVTQARRALWPLILEPKLGTEAGDYRWSESIFAEEEIIMHTSPDWLPPGYKNWDALLTEAVRRGMKNGKAPGDVAEWSYGSWHVVDIEHPLAGFLPLVGRIAGTGEQPLSGDTTTVKQSGRDFGPSQRFTMDWSNIDGSTENIVLGESSNPLSPYFRDQWNDWYGGTTFAFPFTPPAIAVQTRHTLRLLP